MLYGSFSCGFCASTGEVVDELLAHFGTQLRYVFRHFPAGEPFARDLALASEVAARQGRFWQFHDAVLAAQPISNTGQLYEAAARAGMNLRLLRNELASPGPARRVEEDETSAADMGLRSTPSIFIQEVLYDGPRDTDSLIRVLRNHLDRR